MKTRAKFVPLGQESRHAEAAKTARLRALRLAKEAADKEAAVQLAAASPRKTARSRGGA